MDVFIGLFNAYFSMISECLCFYSKHLNVIYSNLKNRNSEE